MNNSYTVIESQNHYSIHRNYEGQHITTLGAYTNKYDFDSSGFKKNNSQRTAKSYKLKFYDLLDVYNSVSLVSFCNDLLQLYHSDIKLINGTNQDATEIKIYLSDNQSGARFQNGAHTIHLNSRHFASNPFILVHELIHVFTNEECTNQGDSDYGENFSSPFERITNPLMMSDGKSGIFLDFYNNLLIHGVHLYSNMLQLGFNSTNRSWQILRQIFLPEPSSIDLSEEELQNYYFAMDIFCDARLSAQTINHICNQLDLKQIYLYLMSIDQKINREEALRPILAFENEIIIKHFKENRLFINNKLKFILDTRARNINLFKEKINETSSKNNPYYARILKLL